MDLVITKSFDEMTVDELLDIRYQVRNLDDKDREAVMAALKKKDANKALLASCPDLSSHYLGYKYENLVKAY
ncbi:MAG TPA: hypothetical protein VIL23_00335 [Clostridia bacterium]